METENIKQILNKEILSNKLLKDNIISIYIIGSLARGRFYKKSDIDLNIFVKSDNSDLLIEVKKLCSNIKINLNIKIDVNFILEKEFIYGDVNSKLFVHNSRHSLFLYELSNYKMLVYGDDILDKIEFKYSDLFFETVKLSLTLSYRLSKEYLTTSLIDESQIEQSIKFVNYAVEFSLIHKGILLNTNINNVYKLFTLHYKNIPQEIMVFIEQCFYFRQNGIKNFNLTDVNILFKSYNTINIINNSILESFYKIHNKKYILLGESNTIKSKFDICISKNFNKKIDNKINIYLGSFLDAIERNIYFDYYFSSEEDIKLINKAIYDI